MGKKERRSAERQAEELAKEVPAELTLAFERRLKRAADANKLLKAQLEACVKALESSEEARDILLGLSERANTKAWAKPSKVDRGEATAMLVVSDLHIGEVVRPSQVLGLNEFNHEVAARRIEQVFRRTLLLTDQARTLAKIEEGVVFLGGDIIGGKIHSDQVEVNDLGIASSIELAEELLERGLRTLLTNGGFKRLTVVCLSGNHDRLTHKVQHSSFFENSHASTIYLHLRKRFADAKNVQWVLGDGEYADVPIYGWNFRLTHGHRVKFSGGVGGLSIPWNKHVMRLNNTKKAHFTIGGHLHTFTPNFEVGWLVNGAVIGTTAYSLPFGHQEPCQSFLVVDRERCVTQAMKVYCS